MRPMRLWLAVWIVYVGMASVGIAQEPGDSGAASHNASNSIEERLRSLSSLHSQRFTQSGGSSIVLPDRNSERGNAAGGASLANFSELMNLIESVIDAPWANNGGTATMFPFRNGVRVDPTGMIERLDATNTTNASSLNPTVDQAPRAKPMIRLDELGAWQQSTPLRWVSLHALDAQLASCREQKTAPNIAMELLGGLCRIDYVAFDASSGEWLLGGPAGNIVANPHGDLIHGELRLPPILLEDLLTISPHVLQNHGEFGCSIDPVQERLVAAYKMAQRPTALRDLRSDPEYWAEEWKTKLGRQQTKVIGIPDDSPTGYALLVADAHMKRIALGLEPAVDGLNNYWLEADAISQTHKGPLVRWWFTLSESRIPWDPERKIAHFAESNVRVLSQSQILDPQGGRVATEKPDRAADAFARGFTAKFGSLQRTYPAYGRLRHIFDLSVAMEIVRAQIQAGHGKPFQCLSQLESQPHLLVAPREIDSVVSTRRSSDGSVSAIISGGVSIHPTKTSERIRRMSKGLDSLIVEASPGERESPSSDSQRPNDSASRAGRTRSSIGFEIPFWR